MLIIKSHETQVSYFFLIFIGGLLITPSSYMSFELLLPEALLFELGTLHSNVPGFLAFIENKLIFLFFSILVLEFSVSKEFSSSIRLHEPSESSC
ncbi:hypothetical protein V6N13_045419 [Hibiscus sabdariffa]